MSYQIASRCVH